MIVYFTCFYKSNKSRHIWRWRFTCRAVLLHICFVA